MVYLFSSARVENFPNAQEYWRWVPAQPDNFMNEESASAPFRMASMTAKPFWLCPIFKALLEVQY